MELIKIKVFSDPNTTVILAFKGQDFPCYNCSPNQDYKSRHVQCNFELTRLLLKTFSGKGTIPPLSTSIVKWGSHFLYSPSSTAPIECGLVCCSNHLLFSSLDLSVYKCIASKVLEGILNFTYPYHVSFFFLFSFFFFSTKKQKTESLGKESSFPSSRQPPFF